MATGKFRNALNALAFSSIDGAADYWGFFDASATEEVKILMSELLKRLLSSGDVSWMSTLAITGADSAADKFLIWDNSATAFKVMTASELLNKTFAGTSISGINLAANLAAVESGADYFVFFDASVGIWRKLLTSELTSWLNPQYAGAITSTPMALTAALTGKRYSNIGATQVIVFTLPAATAGLRYAFSRVANYAIRIDPNGSETIGEGGAGKYMEITGRGATNIECLAAGSWEVTGGSAIYDFEA